MVCDYISDCIYDFNKHTHSQDADNENPLFTCNVCEESFQTLPEVMKYNKAIHLQCTTLLTIFGEGLFFGKKCWCLHSESLKKF